jgi:omega-3 fatty acid desaturase (delta-15 desaturase)
MAPKPEAADGPMDAKRGSSSASVLQLNSLRKAIPNEAFVKSAVKAGQFMLFDYAIWLGAVYSIYTLRNSEVWTGLPEWQQWAATLIYWNVAGFFMWCIFVVGHDCGHGTFSESETLNDIIGHITHGSIMVPFYPWQLSHRRHHMYHNHIDKDYSHPWYTPDRLARPDEGLARMMHSWGLGGVLRFLFPFYGWFIYLYGMPDGSHFIPWPEQRMWKESMTAEFTKCIISALNCIMFLASIFHLCAYDVQTFAYFYAAPWILLGWWLVSVTYLQHHNPDTLVYDDDDWKFVDAAFETVDRQYGFGLDYLHHHITDGHVAHHLFFTKIPHYNLPIATKVGGRRCALSFAVMRERPCHF